MAYKRESVRPSSRPYLNHIWCGALPSETALLLPIMTSKILVSSLTLDRSLFCYADDTFQIASVLVLALVALSECGGHGGGGG